MNPLAHVEDLTPDVVESLCSGDALDPSRRDGEISRDRARSTARMRDYLRARIEVYPPAEPS